MPAFVNDNLIWIIAAVVIGVVALLLVMRSGKSPAIQDAGQTIEAVEVPPPPAPAPEPVAANLTAIGIPVAIGPPDNLLLLKGVGPKLNTMLTGFGITRFDQIAAWGDTESATVDGHLGTFQGRISRDNWIEQAGLLASGDIAAFEAKFGKLDGPIA